jgi:HNH endonuclease
MAPAIPCLYCSSVASSNEHVISEALGCKEIISDAICRKCNSTFGHSFEAEFINGLALFLNFFQIPNGEGKIPSIEVSGKFESEEIKFKITGDGKAEAHPMALKDGADDSVYGKKFRVFHRAQEEKIEHALRGRHPDLVWNQIHEYKALEVVDAQPKFDPGLLCSPEANRNVAKYALNLLVRQFGQRWASYHAQSLISYVKAEPSSVQAGIIWEPAFQRRFPFAPPKHLFAIVCNSAGSTITIFQYLFCLFPYCVTVPSTQKLIDYVWLNSLGPKDGKFVPLFLSGAPELLSRQGLTPFPMPEFEFSGVLQRAELGTPKQAEMAAKNAIQFMEGYSAASATPHICYNCKKILPAVMEVCPYCGRSPLPDGTGFTTPESRNSNS